MFSRSRAAGILFWATLALLLLYSLRRPDGGDSSARGLSVLMEPDGTGVWRDLVAKFNSSHPGAPVRLIEGPTATDTREDMYSTAFLARGSSYDIVYCDGIWIAKFAAAGWLADLTARLREDDRRDILPVELQAGEYEGKLYRMPAFTDAGVLYYRTDLVKEPPETFEELTRIARASQTGERWGYLWQGQQYEGLVTVFLEVLWGFGGDWIDSSSRKVLLDSREAVEAVTWLKGTIGTISPPAVTTYTEEATRNNFQNGRAVFLRNWPYVWTLINRRGGEMAANIGVAPPVHAEGEWSTSTLGGWGFAISRFSRDPDRAWQFVEFVTRPQQLREVQQRQGRIPSRRSMIPGRFLPILESAHMRPAIPEYAQASDILQRWLSAALTGRVTAEEAVKGATRETWQLLKT